MIRAATKKDLESVYALMRQLSRHGFTKEQFCDCYEYNLEKRRVLVYENESFICGCIVFIIHYHLHFSRKTAEIVDLVVDKNVRSQGIGRILLESVEQIAIGNGCVCIEVDSNKQREDAHRFYEREGFANTHCKLTKGLI